MWILLRNNISQKFNFNKSHTYLLELSKINILVGKNNSGKSYLMREIIKDTIKILNRDEIKNMIFEDKNFRTLNQIEAFTEIQEFKTFNKKYISMLKQIEEFDKRKRETGSSSFGGEYSGKIYNFTNFDELKSNSKELLEYLGFGLDTEYRQFSDQVIHGRTILVEKIVREYKEIIFTEYDNMPDESIYQFGEILYNFGYVNTLLAEYNNFYSSSDETREFYKNYIPILRNIRHPLKNTKDRDNCNNDNIFKNRIIDEYQYNEKDVNVITGLDFYFEYKAKLLGTKKERSLTNEFEKFLSNYFFEGKEISIIPDEKTYELKVNIQDSEDKFIYEVGDGITSLIIIMYNVFMRADNKINIFFIEEPEQNFHPGFQRLFMNIISLNEKFKNCYFFFTTHSNHLIDISNHEFKNFTNYLCSKNDNDINIKVQGEFDIEAIEELGVSPSSVQIANKIIWVEGKYDALYIRLLLAKKNAIEDKRKYIEEYDYVFVPYGGSNGTLINFSIENSEEENKEFILKAKKINNNFLLIMDDDGIAEGNAGSKKKIRYNELKGRLKEQLYKLEVREIENLFPEEVIVTYFSNGLKNANKKKLDFLKDIKYNDYKTRKLGEYLNELVKENIGKDLKKVTGRAEGFEKNGFLYDKSKFYNCVLDWITSRDFNYDRDLPDETKKLIDIVEKFIRK